MDSHHSQHSVCNNTCALVEILGAGNQTKHSNSIQKEDGKRERKALRDVYALWNVHVL